MRWALRLLTVGIMAALAAYLYFPTSTLVASVPAPDRPPAGDLGWISAVGERLVDDRGRTVLLRGFNSEALLDDPDHEAAPLDRVDLQLMRESGYGSFSPPAFDSKPQGLRSYLTARVDEAHRLAAPAWIGETGFDRAQPQAARFADESLDAYDDMGLGWGWWQWRQNGSWGIRSYSGGAMDTSYLRHLARPFLASAPRGVLGGRGDGMTGHLQVTVDAGHGPGEVEVSWPKLTVGRPVAAGPCLARDEWHPESARLMLQLKPAQGCLVQVSAVGA